MADDLQRRLAMAAAAGLLAGLGACSDSPPPQDPSTVGSAEPTDPASAEDAPDETDVAAGDKGCCGPGTNACEGKGQCSTEANACRGQNSCKGKGGCFAKDCPKEQSRWQKLQGGEAAPEGDAPGGDAAPEGDASGEASEGETGEASGG